jgi:hypothetical protein
MKTTRWVVSFALLMACKKSTPPPPNVVADPPPAMVVTPVDASLPPIVDASPDVGVATDEASVSACERWCKSERAAVHAAQKTMPWPFDEDDVPQATCTMEAAPVLSLPEPGVVLTLADVESWRPYPLTPDHPAMTHFKGTLLTVRTTTGLFITEERMSGTETGLYWTMRWHSLGTLWVTTPLGPRLALQTTMSRATDSDGLGGHSEETDLLTTLCVLSAKGPQCKTKESKVADDADASVFAVPVYVNDAGTVTFDIPKNF